MPLSLHDYRISLHHELVQLTRGLGGLRLAIADGVERLEALGGVRALGFPNVDAYARERLGRSGRWVGDARTLARRLAVLPLLREAYLSGRLSTSKVELLARHLRGRRDLSDTLGDEEADAIELAAGLTVHELRRRLGGGGDDTRRTWVQLTRHLERVDAVAFEGAIRLMNALGEPTRSAAVEGLLAEGLTTLLDRAELAPDLANRIAATAPGTAAAPGDEVADPATADPDTDIGPAFEQSSIEPPYIDPTVTDVGLLDLELRALSADLTRRDLRLGLLALEAERSRLPLTPGYRTADDYFREALGMAPSSMAARIALARRVDALPRLKATIEAGAIGFETATLLARIAGPTTEEAWLTLASISTTKIFREHVGAAELHARVDGLPVHRLALPTADQVEDVRALERQVLTTVFAGRPDGTEADPTSEPSPTSVPSLSAGSDVSEVSSLGTVPLRLTLPEDLASFWCDLEVLHADAGFPAGSFVGFLVASTLAIWRGMAKLSAYGDIYLRDRFRCQSPVCHRRNCTPHHIVFRSHGGGEEPSNLVSLCEKCHLSLVHEGHLVVRRHAPDALTWSARTYHLTERG
jgi:hypothetical protein